MFALTWRDVGAVLCPPILRVQRKKLRKDQYREDIDVLSGVIMDLLMEVEALREAHLSSPEYIRAYREVSLLQYHNGGPSMGLDKLLWRYYPSPDDDMTWCERLKNFKRVWREELMLDRLGYTEDEIEAFKDKAREMEAYT